MIRATVRGVGVFVSPQIISTLQDIPRNFIGSSKTISSRSMDTLLVKLRTGCKVVVFEAAATDEAATTEADD